MSGMSNVARTTMLSGGGRSWSMCGGCRRRHTHTTSGKLDPITNFTHFQTNQLFSSRTCFTWFLLCYLYKIMATDEASNEDILSEALEFLGGKPVIDDDIISYGPLKLTLAQKVRIELFLCPGRISLLLTYTKQGKVRSGSDLILPIYIDNSLGKHSPR
jgi:hypothetical protein